ncbi:MAG: hypothetical protein ACOC8E_06720 [Planctomycetota bacterium]
MADQFTVRVRTAAVATWWTVLIGFIWMAVSFGLWRVVLGSCGLLELVQDVWGPGFDTVTMGRVGLVFFGIFKLILFVWVLAAICLSLWARKLRQQGA